MSTPLVYYKPISLADRLLIDTVCHRYEGVSSPFVKFEDDEKVTLCVPADIRRVSYGSKALKANAVCETKGDDNGSN